MKTKTFDFSIALAALKNGKRVAREGWNGKGLWVELQSPDAYSKMTLPYLYLNYPQDAKNTPGARVPWLPSQTDLLADDWTLVEAVSSAVLACIEATTRAYVEISRAMPTEGNIDPVRVIEQTVRQRLSASTHDLPPDLRELCAEALYKAEGVQ